MKYVILAGGSGTRLWPFSRNSFPKQFLHFGDGESLLQKTVKRFYPSVKPTDILIVTNQAYFHLVKNQLCAIDPGFEKQIIIEPERKNTAPAICLAVKYLQEVLGVGKEECILVSSSDHIISPEKVFLAALNKAEEMAQKGHHVIFGIRPNKPETGYGYIKAEETEDSAVRKVEQFVEKPDYPTAQKYLLSGEYLWNSGIFLFQIESFLNEIAAFCPAIASCASGSFKEFVSRFSEMPDVSVDCALMERSQNTMVMPLDVSWSDVGSWDSVYDLLDKDKNQNVKVGNVIDIDTKNCLIMGDKRLISTIGLEDLLIIETEDALFIGKKGESQKVKNLVEELKKRNAKEPFDHLTSHRPWGKFTVLEEGTRYKIKRIVVDSGQRLSLQKHYHRSEHWVVVKGTAKVTIGDREQLVHENESVYVPKSEMHRLENPGKVPLELIEVQVGEYVGEDDIVRFDDIYGRADGKNDNPVTASKR
ncbi:MAG: mannose-1-phosphate guanylyltransferase/mannose-6-phosphate isomerase [Verrucomicrobia bacterium]|nr:mannose-1-phosphate guanylyltransferase/mannose-6-phosphate isomerase [Verrucomicrobiota bacterium]